MRVTHRMFCAALGVFVALGISMTFAKEPRVPPLNRPADEAAQQPDTADSNVSRASLFNLQLPTAGGKQFWTDHRWRDGWRI